MGAGKSSRFEWCDAMSVGVKALDSDHKCLVRIINLLSEVSDDEDAARMVEMVLDTLMLYGRFHFAREEKVMETCGFPGAGFHRAEHQGFARYVGHLRERLGRKADGAAAAELLAYLTGWLSHHILIQDMAFKPYVAGVSRMDNVAWAAGPPLLEFQL
ncbi:MAG: bacteriohemerythrin [Rhodospirillales bacterium]